MLIHITDKNLHCSLHLYPRPQGNKSVATISLLPSHRDNGHSLFCSLAYSSEFGTDLSASAPKCGFEKMEVKFGPKFTDCNEVQTFKERKKKKKSGGGGGSGGGGSDLKKNKKGTAVVAAKSDGNKGAKEEEEEEEEEEGVDDGYYRVKCKVEANPPPPPGNFTWAFFNMTSGR